MKRTHQRFEVRTKLTDDNLLIMRGPAAAGPQARAEDEKIAAVRTERLTQAIGESLISVLSGEFSSELVRRVNGADPRPRLGSVELEQMELELASVKTFIAETESILGAAENPDVQRMLRAEIDRRLSEQRRLEYVIELERRPPRRPEPHEAVEVEELCAALGAVLSKRPEAAEMLDQVVGRPQLVSVDRLTVHFETYLFLPTSGNDAALVGPISIAVENTKRLKSGERADALADLCLQRAWPVSRVAEGIPLISGRFQRERLAAALGRKLKPEIGAKAASVLGGCEAPEVLAVVSAKLGYGQPGVEVEPRLATRIVGTYIANPPIGHNSWRHVSDRSPLVAKMREVHQYGQAHADLVDKHASHWEMRGWIQRSGNDYVAQRCRCGSTDLALIPTPEPKGLVCLRCREDREGLVIPRSWNAAICDKQYWEARGYDLTAPVVPGVPTRRLAIAPISYYAGR